MKLALYERHDAPPKPVDLSWFDFEALLMRAPPVVANPDLRPAFGPHVLRGARRLASEVLELTAQVFDFDNISHEEASRVRAKVARFQGLIYTTWGYGTPEKGIALRLVLPCAATSVSRWRKARRRLLAYLGVADDPRTQDPSRLFYVPCYRPGEPTPGFIRLTGAPFDPATLPGEKKITGEDLVGFRRYLAKKKHNAASAESKKQLELDVAAVDALLIGDPYAEPGDRDNTMFSLAVYIVGYFGTDLDTDHLIYDVFDRSLRSMSSEHQHNHAREKFERVLVKQREQDASDTEERIRQHFKRIGRADRIEPYNHEEIVYMRETFCDREAFAYLVHALGDVYGLTVEGYQPYGRATMPDVIRALAPFPEINLRSNSGTVHPAKSLLDEYGQHAHALEYSYLQAASTFDGTKLTVATAPRRVIAPLYDAEMDAWINLLGGTKALALRQWLAWVPHLDQALMALHLHGPPGTGKSLFAAALARPWGDPANMVHALGEFNDVLLRCPIVLADEHFPTHATNANAYKTQEFRELVQSNAHKVHAKFKGIAMLRGYVRCIVATNNKHMFKLAQNAHSKDDIDAIHERTLRVHVTEASRDFLRTLNVKSIAETDRFIAHVLTFPRPAAAHRFGVEPQPLDYSLVVDQFVPSRVLELLFTGLELASLPHGYRVIMGAVYVSPAHVRFPSELKIKTPDVFEAIASISDGQDGPYLRIATRALAEYASGTGLTIEWLAERLAHHEKAAQKEAN